MLGELPSCWRGAESVPGVLRPGIIGGRGQEAGRGRCPSEDSSELAGPELGTWLAEGHAQACPAGARSPEGPEALSWGPRLPLGLCFGWAVWRGANVGVPLDSVSSPVICGKRGFHMQVVRVKLNGKSVREPPESSQRWG